MDSLWNRWKAFIGVALDPWTLLLLVGTIYFVATSLGQTNMFTAALLTVVAALAAGLLGARVQSHWTNLTEGPVLVARGKSAIRNLKLLLNNVASLEGRVRQYLQRYAGEGGDKEPIRLCFEEVVEKCNVLEEEVLNSIENWTDIIPEADVRTQIGIISDLKQQVFDSQADLTRLKEQLLKAEESKKEATEELRKEITAKVQQLNQAREELRKKQQSLDRTVLGGLGTSVTSAGVGWPTLDTHLSSVLGLALTKPCRTCSRLYQANLGSLAGSLADDGRCPECKAKEK